MERRLLFILSLLLPTLLMANPVGKEQAQEKALSFLNGRSAAKARGPKAASNLRLVMSQDCYHVFNIGTGDGFVIVSGDDCAPDILGYADSGTIAPESIPDNMKAWLQGYADQIEWMKAHGVKASQTARTRAAKSSISPLLESEWNQSAPYNNECPIFVNGARSVTGCVATAMAQIMFYHQWPSKTILEIPSYQFASGYAGGPLTVSAIPANTEFNWSNMTPYYTSSSTDAENAAVATLMSACGASVQMNYADDANGGSSASTSKVADALKTYFDYNGTAQNLGRDRFSYAQWIDIIYTELAAKRPVLIGGQSTGGGHAFVCDGFDEDDLFHINWGWGGMSDGYFRISVLAPDEQGAGGSTTSDGYRMWQDITVGIQKNIGTTEPLYTVPAATNPTLEADGDITLSTASPKTGEEVDITVAIKNTGSEDYHGDITFVLLNGTTIKEKLGGLSTDIEAGATKSITITATPSTAGTFNLAVMKGYFEYATVLKEKEVTIGTGVSAETATDVALTFTIAMENVTEESGTKYILGNTVRATITVTNNTDTNYQGFIGAYLWDRGTGSISTGSVPSITVNAHSSKTISVERDVEYDKQYSLYPAYYKGQDASDKPVWGEDATTKEIIYTAKPAIAAYQANGSKTIALAKEAYTIPADAVAVDLRGQTTVTSVTPNSNPNTIYLLDASASTPSGISGNIVKGTIAESITLTDGYDFYSPIDFTATNISYTRTFTTGYTVTDGKSAGWTTINLPFDVSGIEAGGETIDWFHSNSDTGKNFWLAEFTSDNSTGVTFDYATALKANTPYIIAVPGNQWGSKWDLTSKAITFKGTGANIKANAKAVKSGTYVKFNGTTKQQALTSVFNLNAAGNKFEKGDATVPAFRAYFSASSVGSTATSLGINFGGNDTAGISTIEAQQDKPATVYDLRGMKVGTVDQISTLPKGIYIINGKKIIK